jgi:hypothetical protein
VNSIPAISRALISVFEASKIVARCLVEATFDVFDNRFNRRPSSGRSSRTNTSGGRIHTSSARMHPHSTSTSEVPPSSKSNILRGRTSLLSEGEAAFLSFVIVVATVLVMVGVGYGVYALLGSWPAVIAVIGTEVAILTFVTVHAYPPGVKPPWVRLFILTVLISIVVPLAYVSWLWMSGRKWAQIPPSG